MDGTAPVYDLAGYRKAVAGIDLVDDPQLVRLKSRDFFWYSPILKAELNRKSADLVVVPKDQDEALRAIGACAQLRIPLVVRGGGTGNYGQLVPLHGGILLDTSRLDRTLFVNPGAARFEAGANLVEIDRLARAIGWEMRMHPSTKRMSAIGGFVAGGAAGVGSAMLGQLRDWGSIPGVRVATCEASPRVLDLRGRDVAGATHAYGTTGVILEVEIALSPVWPWFDSVVAFDDFMDAARFGQALGEADGIVKKEIAVCAWPIPAWFKALKTECPEGKHVAFCMIAESDRAAYEALAADHNGRVTAWRPTPDETVQGETPIYEYCWNHTTLQALKVDKGVTYLQTVFPIGRNLEIVEKMYRHYGDEVMLHLEFQRRFGRVNNSALQVVRWTTKERLYEIIRHHEAEGCIIPNPHTYILEDKGPKVVAGDRQLAFKRHADPHGLLNPGKMTRWTPQ
jgi:FAD/FMN-containing dehydrogenase